MTQGASQAFTITASTGYQVKDVLVDGVSVGAVTSYTFSNVTAAHSIAASFVAKTYAITASAGKNGAISPTGSVSVSQGASQAFTITANTGYQVKDVRWMAIGWSGTVYTFSNVTAAHSIAASFAGYQNKFTISATAGTGGIISPSGAFRFKKAASTGLYHHGKHRLSGEGCPGGWIFSWSGDILYLFKRNGQSQHLSKL